MSYIFTSCLCYYQFINIVCLVIINNFISIRYDLYDVEIDIKDRLETENEWIIDPHHSFVTIEMDEILFEGGRSIRCVVDMLYISYILSMLLHILYFEIYKYTLYPYHYIY